MKPMRVAGNYSLVLKPEQRPYGHLFVRSNNAAKKNPTYWGEFKFKTNRASVSFCYIVYNLNKVDRTYGLSLFSDREFEWCFLTTDISFFDGSSRLIDNENTYVIGMGLGEFPEKLLNITHSMVYHKMLIGIPFTHRNEPTAFYPTIHQHGYVFGIEKRDIEEFEDENNASLSEFITQMNLLLG